MNATGFMLVGLAALLTVAANLMLRVGLLRGGGLDLAPAGLPAELWKLARQPLFVTGVIAYAAAALVWFRVISTENLSTSYPLLVSLTFIFVTLLSVWLLKEPLSATQAIGIVIIVVGIFLVARY